MDFSTPALFDTSASWESPATDLSSGWEIPAVSTVDEIKENPADVQTKESAVQISFEHPLVQSNCPVVPSENLGDENPLDPNENPVAIQSNVLQSRSTSKGMQGNGIVTTEFLKKHSAAPTPVPNIPMAIPVPVVSKKTVKNSSTSDTCQFEPETPISHGYPPSDAAERLSTRSF